MYAHLTNDIFLNKAYSIIRPIWVVNFAVFEQRLSLQLTMERIKHYVITNLFKSK